MSLTKNRAAEQYERVHNQLMVVAENYNAPDEAREIALMAAHTLTIDYIEMVIDEIEALNVQYETFVNTLEKTLLQLEKTMLDRLILAPLTKSLKKSLKKSPNHQIHSLDKGMGWSKKVDLIFKWFRIRIRWK
jgi:hypothetical protein